MSKFDFPAHYPSERPYRAGQVCKTAERIDIGEDVWDLTKPLPDITVREAVWVAEYARSCNKLEWRRVS